MARIITLAGTTSRMIIAFICALIVPAAIQAQPLVGPFLHR